MAPGARPRCRPAYPVHFSFFFFGVRFLAWSLETRKMADALVSCSAPAGCPVRCGSRGPVPSQSIKTSTARARQCSAQGCGVLICRLVSRGTSRGGFWRELVPNCLFGGFGFACCVFVRCRIENSLNPFKLGFACLIWFGFSAHCIARLFPGVVGITWGVLYSLRETEIKLVI